MAGSLDLAAGIVALSIIVVIWRRELSGGV